jgi:AmmeMemoRadiSam system protein B
LLATDAKLFDDPAPHRAEHSLEMQLPFLRHLVPDVRIVPVLMGSQSREEVERLTDALVEVGAGPGTLLIASSDLSHYHPAVKASALDARVMDAVERFDPAGLMDLLETPPVYACGGGPMTAVMSAARRLGAGTATVLRYADSGDVPPHDKDRVVGYLSAAFSR